MMLDRRSCLAAALSALASRSAHAQAKQRMLRIGIVSPRSPQEEPAARASTLLRQLAEGLREQGFVEGRDFGFELRFAAGQAHRLLPLSEELAALPVDLLLSGVCGAPLDAARRATRTIPIVVPTCNDDLVELGIVQSLNRPGGNITGLSKLTPELAPKRLQLLLQAVPAARRVGVLWNPAYAEFKADWRELRVAAGKLGVALLPAEFRDLEELGPATDALAKQRADALLMFSEWLSYIYPDRIVRVVNERRLPGIFAMREVADAGGLMSYGPSLPGMWRQSARLVARILRGEKPGDVPIEQPTRLELAINLKTARTLGIAVPQELLLRADAVIE